MLALGIAGSQAGHLLAYVLRFGGGAVAVQASGAHAYFPALAKTLLGGGALVLLGALLMVGLARLAAGRRIEPASSPPFVRLLAVVFTVQLTIFVAQESVEGSFTSQVVLWGVLGQLPVAAAGALALRWLLARVGPAIGHLLGRCEAVLDSDPLVTVAVLKPAPIPVHVTRAAFTGSISRRGPPSF